MGIARVKVNFSLLLVSWLVDSSELGCGLSFRVGVHPLAVFADEVHEAFDGFVFGDVEFDGGFADVEVDFAGGAADVSKVGVGHFARAVDDAAHNGDFDAFEVGGAGFDAGGDGLEVEEGASAGRAGDVVGLEAAAAGSLEDVVGELECGAGGGLTPDQDGVANAVAEEGAEYGGGGDEGVGGFLGRDGLAERGEGVFEEDGVFEASASHAGGEQAVGGDGVKRAGVADGDDGVWRWRGELDGVGLVKGEVFEDGFGFNVGLGGDARGQGVVMCACDDNGDGFIASKSEPVWEGEGLGGMALVVEEVARVGGGGEFRDVNRVAGEFRNLRDEALADGDFVVGVFGQ